MPNYGNLNYSFESQLYSSVGSREFVIDNIGNKDTRFTFSTNETTIKNGLLYLVGGAAKGGWGNDTYYFDSNYNFGIVYDGAQSNDDTLFIRDYLQNVLELFTIENRHIVITTAYSGTVLILNGFDTNGLIENVQFYNIDINDLTETSTRQFVETYRTYQDITWEQAENLGFISTTAGNIFNNLNELKSFVNSLSPVSLSSNEAYNYLASNSDLINAFGSDTNSASNHYFLHGISEGRPKSGFDAWKYLASNPDLISAFGANTYLATKHFVEHGFVEGRVSSSFDVTQYLSNYPDLVNAFNNNSSLAIEHYVKHGYLEGRNDRPLDPPPLITGPSGTAGDGTSIVSIKENNTTIHTFNADKTVTWSISGGLDKDLFTINTNTGLLSFKTPPDYENSIDTDENNSYLVIVRATDITGITSDQIVTTTVTDLGSNDWTEVDTYIDGEASNDFSGLSVSLSNDGSVVAIGAPNNDGNGTDSGHVSIFKNINGSWTQVGSDIDGEASNDFSGSSVSLSGDGNVVAIGAPNNDGNGTDSGHVSIFKNVNNTWTQVGFDIDGEASNDISGHSVSLSNDGSVVAIGAPYNDGNGTDSGHVSIFKNFNNTWTQIGSDIDGEASNDLSGLSVGLSGDGNVVAIGASSNNGNGTDSGHVRIFKNVNNTWTQIGSDIDGEASNDISGYSVSLSNDGSVVAIGATGNDDNGTNSGHVRIFKNFNNTWTQIGSDIDGEASNDLSGSSVSLSGDGNVVAIGASGNDDNGTDSGHVRIFKNVNNTWTQIGSDIDGEASNDISGYSVSLSNDGSVVAIGAPYNYGNGTDSGHVRVYQIDLNTSSPTTLSNLEALKYIASNPDLIGAFGTNIDAAKSHYLNHGYAEGRSLNSFSASDYLAKYSDLFAAFGNDETLALKHYIQNGYAEGRTDSSSGSGSSSGASSVSNTSSPTALSDFEALNYIASHSDLISVFGINTSAASSHYVNNGYAEGRSKDNFDEWGYLASNTDLMGAFGSNTTEAIKHYISYGKSEGRSTNLFNAESYLNNYADLKNAFENNYTLATKHYVEYGFNEGRSF